ncbi:polysaccharide biosynthesis protein [Algiphilus sp. NNCM1]|uniref:polysaccharide biosynthesis protein n=1 Tax=Algiphilus sp. TaxID=1872431 RepID=UPI001CA6C0B5|nr:nucleoside-diphosphate sugar epimerase/dehydratase [Algiphilus sp.]MBY8965022.1 polysaccharide biosynthesis protein [Algiphilus acroporae]MCI5104178.1 polysaccharide biosynthesis protein [Algiphilus sp.]
MNNATAIRTTVSNRLLALSPEYKVAIAALVDGIASLASLLIALLLAGGVAGFLAVQSGEFSNAWLLAGLFTPTLLKTFGAYRAVTRFLQAEIFGATLLASAGTALVLVALGAVAQSVRVDWRAALIFTLLNAVLLSAWRLMGGRFLRGDVDHAKGVAVAIYGAGAAGQQLLSALRYGATYRPVIFLDDRRFQGRKVMGLPVVSPDDMEQLRFQGVQKVLLAMPSASRARRNVIAERLTDHQFQVMEMPGLDELARGDKSVDDLRPLDIEDLLGREQVAPNPDLLSAQVTDKVVLVTGAGGSIGSELARQVSRLNPQKLVLLDASEAALYHIDYELRGEGMSCELVSILGNVCDEREIRALFAKHDIDTVYHSAAYKHVPLVEDNIITAGYNNIIGTERVVRLSMHAGVQNFVLVSTDKAVRPTNVMGATKRFCELVVQAYATRFADRSVCCVRFGNVLGSSGSVVPLFHEQIKKGGPVTVTHPEVTRYFMLIPEAASLVIQAGAMGRHGEVFVLDMGQPIKIRALAERMINLSGLTVRNAPDDLESGDIGIQYTGLRPGEKLYEELLIGNQPEQTVHPRIMKARETALEPELFDKEFEVLQHAIEWRNEHQFLTALCKTVSGFERRVKDPEAVAEAGPRSVG